MPSTPSSSRSSRSKSRSAAPPERRISITLLLLAAHQRMAQVFDRELAADGVDSSHYGTLSLIGAYGPIRLTEIASTLGMPLTTASDIVRRLEGRGHVRRMPNPDDGRSFLFELTARGDREWKRGWGALQRIMEGLDVDQDEMRAALTKLNAAFERLLTDS